MSDDPKKDEQQDDLQAKVEEAQQKDEQKNAETAQAVQQEDEVERLKDQLARCMADMQNYKRRAEEEKMQFARYANSEFLKDLIPIIDNFDRACQQVPEVLKGDAWAKGVVNTHDELIKALEKIGVKKIETIGQKLDPTRHEAVLQGPGEKDLIIEELEPGYMYNEVTLKAAKVKVGSGEEK